MPKINDANIHGIIYRLASNHGVSTLNEGLIASWDMRDAQGANRFDYGPNDYELVNNGNVGTTPGYNGSYFSGVTLDDQYLSTDFASAPNIYRSATADPITVAFVGNMVTLKAGNGSFHPFLGIYEGNTSKKCWVIGRESETGGGRILFYVSHNGSATASAIGPTCTLNTAFCIVARYDGAELQLDVNGVNYSTAHTTGLYRDTSVEFKVAKYKADNGSDIWSDCRIDNLSIWDRALTDLEVLEWYNIGAPLLVPFIS